MAFARYKGMAENGLFAAGFPWVQIFRPGYVYPVKVRKEPNLVYTVTRFLYLLLRRLYPNIGISCRIPRLSAIFLQILMIHIFLIKACAK